MTKRKMQKQTEHIFRLNIDGGRFELPSINRNSRRFIDIFLSGKKLCAGCRAVFFYADDLENPFYEIEFTERIRSIHDDWILTVPTWYIRRSGYVGEFTILVLIYDTDSSKLAQITIPIQGKVARKCRNSV